MSHSSASATTDSWLIRIDTGGTFTDAFAISPQGETKRIKVLSSGRIRLATQTATAEGPALERIEGVELLVGAIARDLCSDKELAKVALGNDGQPYLQLFEPGSDVPAIVDLDPSLDAPRLAMHLLTATPLSKQLPPIDLRIATTRATSSTTLKI